MKLKKLLPKNFDDLLAEGDVDALKAVFAACSVDARGGYSKQTAFAFNEFPDELCRWLVEQGADVSAADSYGDTPLQSRAGHWQGRLDILLDLGADVHSGEGGRGTALHKACGVGHADNVRLLLQRGANPDALTADGLTPLEWALQRCSNTGIVGIAKVAPIMLAAGARQTPRMEEFITQIGTQFEFHRAGFNRDSVDEYSAALDRLYSLFAVAPVPRRAMHDGRSPIAVKAGAWQDQHEALWDLLVPSNGPAATVQGEVIRLSGRIANELDGNGGVNWGADFRRMVDALLGHLGSGTSLPAEQLDAAAVTAKAIKQKSGEPARLCEMAVHWVVCNPTPVALPAVDYRR